MKVSKEQEEEFKARFNSPNKVPLAEAREFYKNKPKLSSKQYLKFIKSTDEKCEVDDNS